MELLQTRAIDDPRSREFGVFNNNELQELYNALIVQGKTSVSEAYKGGVAIEEKDISDITKQLSAATESGIVDTLTSLCNGYENEYYILLGIMFSNRQIWTMIACEMYKI